MGRVLLSVSLLNIAFVISEDLFTAEEYHDSINANDTYSVSSFVEIGNSISSSRFAISNSYIRGALTVPIVVLLIGFFSLILMNFSFFYKAKHEVMEVRQTYTDNMVSILSKPVIRSRRNSLNKVEDSNLLNSYKPPSPCFFLSFYLLCIVCFLFAQVIFYGYNSIRNGIDQSIINTNNVHSEFNILDTNGIKMQKNSVLMTDICSLDTCELEHVAADIDQLNHHLTNYNHDINEILYYISSGRDDLKVYVRAYVPYFVSLIYFLCIGIPTAYAAAVKVKYYMYTYMMIGGNIAFVVLSVLTAVWFSGAIMVSNFCSVYPIYSFYTLLDTSKRTAFNYVLWYSTCNEQYVTNPILKYTSAIYASSVKINATMAGLLSSNVSSTQYSSEQLTDYNSILEYTQTNLEHYNIIDGKLQTMCPEVQNNIFDIANSAICTTVHYGVMVNLFVIITINILVLVMICSATVLSLAEFKERVLDTTTLSIDKWSNSLITSYKKNQIVPLVVRSAKEDGPVPGSVPLNRSKSGRRKSIVNY